MADPRENHLTCQRLDELAEGLGLEWQQMAPSYGCRWVLRPCTARLQRRREPASFLLVAGRRKGL